MTVLTAGRSKIRPTYQTIKLSHFKTYHYEDEQKSTEEQRTEIRERDSSKSNRFGNHSKADNVTFTAERAHSYRSDENTRNGNRSHRYGRSTAASHVQNTACNGYSRNRP